MAQQNKSAKGTKTRSRRSNYKPLLLIGGSIILVVMLVVLGTYIKNSGQAIRVTEVGTFKSVSTGGTGVGQVKIDFIKVYVRHLETFDMILSVNTGGKDVNAVEFGLVLPSELTLVSVTPIPAGFGYFVPADNNVHSVAAVSSKINGASVSVATIKIKMNCPSGTLCAVNTNHFITLNNIRMYNLDKTANGPFELSGTAILVGPCIDVDGDGYGTGSDVRGCAYGWNTNIVDCDDNNVNIKPSATESCDGKDNNCDGQIDNDLITPQNDKLQGVCYGNKICTSLTTGGSITWQNSYLVPKTNPAATKLTNSTGGQEYQADLYETGTTETKCDLWDNNCNGIVNDMTGCTFGGGTVTVTEVIPPEMLPPGNAFYDYSTTGAFVAPQTIDGRDVNLVTYLFQVRDDVTKGDFKLLPMSIVFKNQDGWICDNGIYFLKESDGLFYKYDYQNNKVKLVGYTAGIDKVLKDSSGNPVVCSN